MNARWLFSAVVILAVSGPLFGQTASLPAVATASAPAVRDADIPGLLRQLENAGTRQVAEARLMGVSAKQLVPLYEALDGETASAELKKELVDLLPKIHDRLRVTRKSYVQIDEEEQQGWLDDYKRLAPHSPGWDNLALEALKSLSGQPGLRADTAPKFKAAVDAGCTDPVIRYYYITRSEAAGSMPMADALMLMDPLATEIETTTYPAFRKFYVNLRFIELALKTNSTPNAKAVPDPRIDQAIDSALAALPEMYKRPQTGVIMVESLDGIIKAMIARHRSSNLVTAFQQVFASIEKNFPNPAEADALAARTYRGMAWDARGDGFAGTVTDQGWQLFGERIALAKEAAEKGWRLDPTVDGNPTEMILICTAKGEDRAEMEKWFRRAMFANPDNYDACWNKMNFLFPKWGGSEPAVLEFARECVKTGTADNRIPAIMLAARLDLFAYAALPGAAPETWKGYYGRPEVWADVQAAYGKFLGDKSRMQTNRDVYLRDRSNYIQLAFDAERWTDVLQLAAEFGEDIDPSTLRVPYRTLVDLARSQLGMPPATAPKPAPKPKPTASTLSTVSLHLKNQPLTKIVDGLNGQLGGPGMLAAQRKGGQPAGTFDLEGDQIPLWQAVIQLEAQHPFDLDGMNRPKAVVSLMEAGKAVLGSQISGDVLMLVHPLVRSTGANNITLLNLTIAVDPRIAILRSEAGVRNVNDDKMHRLLDGRDNVVDRPQNAYGSRMALSSMPADVGSKYSFDARVTYTTQVSSFSGTLNDLENHLNEPTPYGQRTFTLLQFSITGRNAAIKYSTDYHNTGQYRPSLDSVAYLYDSTDKPLCKFSLQETRAGRGPNPGINSATTTIPDSKRPYHLIIEYPDKVKDETVNFSFVDVPLTYEQPAPVQNRAAPAPATRAGTRAGAARPPATRAGSATPGGVDLP